MQALWDSGIHVLNPHPQTTKFEPSGSAQATRPCLAGCGPSVQASIAAELQVLYGQVWAVHIDRRCLMGQGMCACYRTTVPIGCSIRRGRGSGFSVEGSLSPESQPLQAGNLANPFVEAEQREAARSEEPSVHRKPAAQAAPGLSAAGQASGAATASQPAASGAGPCSRPGWLQGLRSTPPWCMPALLRTQL